MASGDVGKNVLLAMERSGLKPADLVRAAKREEKNITYQRIQNWKAGDNDPHKDLLPWLARVTGSSVAELLGDVPIDRTTRRPRRAVGLDEIEVPRLTPIRAGEWQDPFDSDATEPIPSFMVDEMTFCAPIEGDSMYPLLQPGDMAVYRQLREPKLGYVYSARNGMGAMTVKQLKHSGVDFLLHPLNPKYKDLMADTWWLEGILTGFIRYMGKEREIRFNPDGIIP